MHIRAHPKAMFVNIGLFTTPERRKFARKSVHLPRKIEKTMEPFAIIQKYYAQDSDAYRILTTHSRSVADKALAIARRHPELNLDLTFIEEAALLHDIGIFRCDAPDIDCHGDAPYICHGYLGAELMRAEGYPRHALVCERHTGTGLSLKMIEELLARNLEDDEDGIKNMLLMGAYYGLVNHYHMSNLPFEGEKMKEQMREMIDAVI